MRMSRAYLTARARRRRTRPSSYESSKLSEDATIAARSLPSAGDKAALPGLLEMYMG